jgi:1-acyl-sn-glycerol-3-phosphate acyltransferase
MLVFRSLLYATSFYVTTALMLIGFLWLLLGPRRWAIRALKEHGRFCTWLLAMICGTHLEVRGRDKLPAGAFMVAAKHQSAWDTFALLPLLNDPAVVLKDELKWIPVYGWFIWKFEHILVKRERAALALKQLIADAKARTAAGRQILIFPEGTRQAPGAQPAYKPGYVAVYEALDVPCVPLALNSGLFWPRRSLLRYPGTIVVEFLDPLPPGLKRSEFRQTVELQIETACARLRAETAAAPMPPPLAFDTTNDLSEIKVRT